MWQCFQSLAFTLGYTNTPLCFKYSLKVSNVVTTILSNLRYNSGSGKPETYHDMTIPVPVWPEPEVTLKIPFPVRLTRIGMPQFWFQFRLGIDPFRGLYQAGTGTD